MPATRSSSASPALFAGLGLKVKCREQVPDFEIQVQKLAEDGRGKCVVHASGALLKIMVIRYVMSHQHTIFYHYHKHPEST